MRVFFATFLKAAKHIPRPEQLELALLTLTDKSRHIWTALCGRLTVVQPHTYTLLLLSISVTFWPLVGPMLLLGNPWF